MSEWLIDNETWLTWTAVAVGFVVMSVAIQFMDYRGHEQPLTDAELENASFPARHAREVRITAGVVGFGAAIVLGMLLFRNLDTVEGWVNRITPW